MSAHRVSHILVHVEWQNQWKKKKIISSLFCTYIVNHVFYGPNIEKLCKLLLSNYVWLVPVCHTTGKNNVHNVKISKKTFFIGVYFWYICKCTKAINFCYLLHACPQILMLYIYSLIFSVSFKTKQLAINLEK